MQGIEAWIEGVGFCARRQGCRQPPDESMLRRSNRFQATVAAHGESAYS